MQEAVLKMKHPKIVAVPSVQCLLLLTLNLALHSAIGSQQTLEKMQSKLNCVANDSCPLDMTYWPLNFDWLASNPESWHNFASLSQRSSDIVVGNVNSRGYYDSLENVLIVADLFRTFGLRHFRNVTIIANEITIDSSTSITDCFIFSRTAYIDTLILTNTLITTRNATLLARKVSFLKLFSNHADVSCRHFPVPVFSASLITALTFKCWPLGGAINFSSFIYYEATFDTHFSYNKNTFVSANNSTTICTKKAGNTCITPDTVKDIDNNFFSINFTRKVWSIENVDEFQCLNKSQSARESLITLSSNANWSTPLFDFRLVCLHHDVGSLQKVSSVENLWLAVPLLLSSVLPNLETLPSVTYGKCPLPSGFLQFPFTFQIRVDFNYNLLDRLVSVVSAEIIARNVSLAGNGFNFIGSDRVGFNHELTGTYLQNQLELGQNYLLAKVLFLLLCLTCAVYCGVAVLYLRREQANQEKRMQNQNKRSETEKQEQSILLLTFVID